MDADFRSGVDLHEDVFVARYAELRRWARRVVGRDGSQADDLVQAAFLRFIQRRPLLARIRNLDRYLFSLVRNLRREEVRRPGVQFEESFVRLESPDDAAASPIRMEPEARDARADLLRICEYAVGRKERSKAASVLLLRFFWGYYPAEIARLARTSVTATNVWLRIARRELRTYDQGQDASEGRQASVEAWRKAIAARGQGEDFLRELRAALGETRDRPCPPVAWYASMYSNRASGVDARTLAHLAVCDCCQEVLSRHLGLRTAVDPIESLGRNNRSFGGRAADDAPNVVTRRGGRVRRAGRAIVALTAAAATVLLSGIFDRGGTSVSAAGLLRELRAAESAWTVARDVTGHRMVVMEQRRVASGAVVQRRHVESWQGAAQGARARRVYDDRRRLLGGEWTGADGSRVIYNVGTSPQTESVEAAVGFGVDSAWRWEPSASDFVRLTGGRNDLLFNEEGERYVVSFRVGTGESGADRVVSASLIITKQTRRAVEQRVIVRQGGEVYEYRFAEVAFDQVSTDRVPSGAFEPERELLGGVVVSTRPVPLASSAKAMRSTVRVRPVEALDRAEMKTVFALHRMEHCLARVPRVVRSVRRLDIEVGVKDVGCRSEVVKLFADVGSPAVRIDVSVQEASGGQGFAAVVAEPIGRPHEGGVSSQTRSLSGVDMEAQAVLQLATDWPVHRLASLDLASRTMWQAMLREHAWRVVEGVRGLKAPLESRVVGSDRSSAVSIPIGDPRGVLAAVEKMATTWELLAPRLVDAATSRVDEDEVLSLLTRLSGQAQVFLDPWMLNLPGDHSQ